MLFAQYNYLSLANYERIHEISYTTSSVDFLAVVGKQKRAIADRPHDSLDTENHHVISGGHRRARRSNRSAGLDSMLNRRRLRKHYIVQTIDPTRVLSGSAAAARVRQQQTDFLIAFVYVPIDFIACPWAFRTWVIARNVWIREARSMQLIRCHGIRDHAPVAVRIAEPGVPPDRVDGQRLAKVAGPHHQEHVEPPVKHQGLDRGHFRRVQYKVESELGKILAGSGWAYAIKVREIPKEAAAKLGPPHVHLMAALTGGRAGDRRSKSATAS